MEQYVPKYYQMDPKTEDLLFDGTYLREGMVVLLGDDDWRSDPELLVTGANSGARKRQLDERNRWCVVSNLKTMPATVAFIGVYPDGTKIKRVHEIVVSWYVKINSVPSEAWNEWAKDGE